MDERDEIRSRIDLVDLVSERVQLKRTGKNYSGLCPFHQDRSPSFNVSPSTGRYKCWSCGEAGDVFTWVMKTQNLDFVEALKLLAEKAGITLTRGFQGDKADKSIREQQLLVMHSALIFFNNELKKNQTALNYLDGRDLDEKLREEWELGFAPDVGEALVVHLKREGKSLASASELFLVQGDERTGYSDKYKGRITFALRDDRGDLVGFAGRVLGQSNTAKYINSGETPLYHKSKVLYGMHKAKDAIAKQRHAVLVEGYLDVIACHRAGVNTAVASCGTALAEDQARLLKRFADKVTILYDGDNAGQKAIIRALEVFETVGLTCRVALLPPGDDPDTLLKSRGAEAVRDVVINAISPFYFGLQFLENSLGLNSEVFWEELVKRVASEPNIAEARGVLEMYAQKHPLIRDRITAHEELRLQVAKARKISSSRAGNVSDSDLEAIAESRAFINDLKKTAEEYKKKNKKLPWYLTRALNTAGIRGEEMKNNLKTDREMNNFALEILPSEYPILASILDKDIRKYVFDLGNLEDLVFSTRAKKILNHFQKFWIDVGECHDKFEMHLANQEYEYLDILVAVESDLRTQLLDRTVIDDSISRLKKIKFEAQQAALLAKADLDDDDVLKQWLTNLKSRDTHKYE